jgi:hypothetical protein
MLVYQNDIKILKINFKQKKKILIFLINKRHSKISCPSDHGPVEHKKERKSKPEVTRPDPNLPPCKPNQNSNK